ncbi:MAG: CocE/NonD family hydrolase, partial [Euryarchaeota archaeon]|nr:CocE/NonD family hydrolase [Euryarchaeota archaeon]
MRRTVVLLSVLLLAVGPLAGCLSTDSKATGSKDPKNIAGAKVGGPAVFPGAYKFDGSYSQVLAKGTLPALPVKKVFIKSDIDGADIEVGYHLPDVPAGTKVPVIVQASPYHRVSRDVATLRGLALFLHDNFLPHGYAVALVSVRGTGNSGGCMDLMGQDEVKDLDKAITWLGTQDWSNGNVAMIGVSYDGSTPWDVASTGNKHLKTIVPISGLPDIYGLMYRNGSAEQRGFLLVNTAYYTYGPSPDDVGPGGMSAYPREPARRVQGTACPDYAVGLEAAGYSTVVGDRDP